MSTDNKIGAVTFLDVVGWMGIWQKRLDAVQELKDLTNALKEKAVLITQKTIELLEGEKKSRYRGIVTDIKSISDTIVFLTPGDADFTLSIHGDLCAYAIASSLIRKIPLRGAISFGEFRDDTNILIGPAVDEAAAWHEMSDWFGVFLTPSAFFSVNEEIFLQKTIWIKHNPPLKSGKFETLCINWTSNFNEELMPGCSLNNLFVDMGPLVPNIGLKYINTMEFYKKNNRQINKIR